MSSACTTAPTTPLPVKKIKIKIPLGLYCMHVFPFYRIVSRHAVLCLFSIIAWFFSLAQDDDFFNGSSCQVCFSAFWISVASHVSWMECMRSFFSKNAIVFVHQILYWFTFWKFYCMSICLKAISYLFLPFRTQFSMHDI